MNEGYSSKFVTFAFHIMHIVYNRHAVLTMNDFDGLTA